MFAPQSRTSRPLRLCVARARAFSLLEVTVAVTIFVVGALMVVQIFPGALKGIAAGSARQHAARLNRAALARVQNEPPLAIYDTQDNTPWTWGDGVSVDGTVEPRAALGSVRRGYSLPRNNGADFGRSALGSLRAIIGESDTVQQTQSGALFVLTQFPIFGDTTLPTQVRVWKRDALDGVTIGADGQLNLRNARLVSTGEPFAPPATGAIYYVSFRYRDNGALWGVSEAPTMGTVAVPDSAPIETGADAATRVAEGTVETTCARLVQVVSARDEGDNKRGLVALSNGSAAVGDAVFVDYQADWGWILQSGVPDGVPEQAPPGAARPRQMALGAPFVQDHAPHSIYTLCQTIQNGKPTLCEGAWGENQTLSGRKKLYTPSDSDLRAGRLTFETGGLSAGETFAGARVAFRTRDGWAQQLSVAAASYKPFGCGPSTPSYLEAGEPWRDYALDAGNGTLYFHASEAGKSVLVTYSYSDGATPPTTTTLRDRLLSIEDAPVQPSNLPAGFAPSGFAAQLQLTDNNGEALAPGALSSITSVRGASVSVRTAWLDGSHYTQSFLPSLRGDAGAQAMR